MTLGERGFLFFASTAVLSLLQFHFDWLDELRTNPTTLTAALQAALDTGPLFFFAVPVSVATAWEVFDHESLRESLLARLMAYLCSFPILAMLFEYFRVRYGAIAPDATYYYTQGGAASLAVVLATTAKLVAYKDRG